MSNIEQIKKKYYKFAKSIREKASPAEEKAVQWWLNEFSTLLSKDRAKTVEEIENCSDFADSGDTLKKRIINLLNNRE